MHTHLSTDDKLQNQKNIYTYTWKFTSYEYKISITSSWGLPNVLCRNFFLLKISFSIIGPSCCSPGGRLFGQLLPRPPPPSAEVLVVSLARRLQLRQQCIFRHLISLTDNASRRGSSPEVPKATQTSLLTHCSCFASVTCSTLYSGCLWASAGTGARFTSLAKARNQLGGQLKVKGINPGLSLLVFFFLKIFSGGRQTMPPAALQMCGLALLRSHAPRRSLAPPPPLPIPSSL